MKNNILDNIKTRNFDNPEKQSIEIPVIETKADPIDIEKIYAEIYTEPKDAYYETDPFQIYPEVNGIDFEISLEEAIDYHNNRKLKSTGFKPIELKDCTNEEIIKQVNKNIIKSMKRKIKKDNKIEKNTLLLIASDIEKKGNRYILKNRKGKKHFVIPAIFKGYINSNTLNVCIKVNLNNELNLRKEDIISISYDCCRIIDDFGFTFYLKEYGEELNFDEIINLALLE